MGRRWRSASRFKDRYENAINEAANRLDAVSTGADQDSRPVGMRLVVWERKVRDMPSQAQTAGWGFNFVE